MRLPTSVATTTLLTAALSFGSLFVLAQPAAAEPTGNQRVTLCHETGSTRHPYVLITIADDGAVHGHYQQHVDLHEGDPGFTEDACGPSRPSDGQAEIPVAGGVSAGPSPVAGTPPAPGTAASPPGTTEAPLAAGTAAPTSGTVGAPRAAGTAVSALGSTEARPAESSSAAVTGSSEKGKFVTAPKASHAPPGGVDAGDGSSLGGSSREFPYVLGGVALTAAGGAAFAARRCSRGGSR